jgi:hypothetical protein
MEVTFHKNDIYGFHINRINNIVEDTYINIFNELNEKELNKIKNIIKILNDEEYNIYVFLQILTKCNSNDHIYKFWKKVTKEQLVQFKPLFN